jgi:hypothetical protein
VVEQASARVARRLAPETGLALALVLLACSPRTSDAPARPATTSDSPPLVENDTSAKADWKIVPGRSAGRLTLESGETDLKQVYGARVVQSTRIELGEGETAPGTVVYPDDSLRRAEILWQDTVARRRPARMILRGSRSLWQAGPGVSLGTNLQELERLNGRPFKLAGFGWDYGGMVTDWAGGALDGSLAEIKLYLDPGPAQYESPAYSNVLGDRDYSSDLPAMQQLNPRVTQIFVDFE